MLAALSGEKPQSPPPRPPLAQSPFSSSPPEPEGPADGAAQSARAATRSGEGMAELSNDANEPDSIVREDTQLPSADDAEASRPGCVEVRSFMGKWRGSVAESPGKKGESGLVKSRLRRLLEARKAEFAEWPPADRDRLLHAFNKADKDGNASLDARGIRLAFSELGLDSRSPEEREVMMRLAREGVAHGRVNFFDFVFNLVPGAEQRILELRSPKLFAAFSSMDSGTGRLNENECMEAILTFARVASEDDDDRVALFHNEFPDVFKQEGGQTVNFQGFQRLAASLEARRADLQRKMEKRIATLAQLPAELEELHLGELTFLKRAFDARDHSQLGVLQTNQISCALVDSGVGPVVGKMQQRMRQLMQQYPDSTVFNFKEFLWFIEGLREEERSMMNTIIEHQLDSSSWQQRGALVPVCDVAQFMVELGICGDCNAKFDDIEAAVADIEIDSDKELKPDSLCTLICKVAERLRAHARHAELILAKQLGFSQEQVALLRDHFAEMSQHGSVGMDEITMLLHKLGGAGTGMTRHDVEMLVQEVCPAGGASADPTPPAGAPCSAPPVPHAEPPSLLGESDGAMTPSHGSPSGTQRCHGLQLHFDSYLRLAAVVASGTSFGIFAGTS